MNAKVEVKKNKVYFLNNEKKIAVEIPKSFCDKIKKLTEYEQARELFKKTDFTDLMMNKKRTAFLAPYDKLRNDLQHTIDNLKNEKRKVLNIYDFLLVSSHYSKDTNYEPTRNMILTFFGKSELNSRKQQAINRNTKDKKLARLEKKKIKAKAPKKKTPVKK